MELAVVLVADTRAGAVTAAVHALVPAITQAEQTLPGAVDVLVVDSSGRTDVAQFLTAVQGARVVAAPGTDRAGALGVALRETTADVLWFGGTDSAPVPTALAAMAAAARDGGLVVAAPDDPAPHVAGRPELLRRLWAAVPEGAGPDPVPALVRQAGSAGVEVVRCPRAGVIRQRVRRSVPNANAVMGPGTYAGRNSLFQTYTPRDHIDVGAYCSIADDVSIVLPGGRLYDDRGAELDLVLRGLHREGSASTFPISILVPDEPYDEPPVSATGERLVIGDDVWIGYGATIVGDVTVGTGSIVGSRAHVVADVPPYSVVGGVPAKVLRKRFEDEVAGRLLRVAWWDWPEAVVQGAHRWFTRPVAEFLDHFDPASAAGTR